MIASVEHLVRDSDSNCALAPWIQCNSPAVLAYATEFMSAAPLRSSDSLRLGRTAGQGSGDRVAKPKPLTPTAAPKLASNYSSPSSSPWRTWPNAIYSSFAGTLPAMPWSARTVEPLAFSKSQDRHTEMRQDEVHAAMRHRASNEKV